MTVYHLLWVIIRQLFSDYDVKIILLIEKHVHVPLISHNCELGIRYKQYKYLTQNYHSLFYHICTTAYNLKMKSFADSEGKKHYPSHKHFFKAGICLFVVSWWFFIFTFLGFFKNILPSKLCYNKFIKCSHKNLLVSFFIIQWKYALFNYSLIQVGWGCNFYLNHVSSLGASECQGTEEGVQFPDLGDTQVIQVVQNNLQQNNSTCTVN